jgi:hypothetical protein
MNELVVDGSAERHDAAEWLASHPDQYAADRFGAPGSALAMVNELLAAGAVHVALLGTGARNRNGPSSMEVELPADPGGRKSAVFEREWERYNEDFSASPDGRDEPQEITREQALVMGHPRRKASSPTTWERRSTQARRS